MFNDNGDDESISKTWKRMKKTSHNEPVKVILHYGSYDRFSSRTIFFNVFDSSSLNSKEVITSLLSPVHVLAFESESSPHISLKLAPQRRSQRGQMQHTNAAAATALYDAGPANDAGDAVMARWLQSAGLQHLASPTGGNDQRHLPSLLMQVLCFPLHSLSFTCMPLVLRS
ncbi:hypothetical protein F2Q68_00017557 [Brassica cretica]|uniref:Uncharacterized protein n=1 Tax=Brassica cretica TaxID=69181 RepID=A0A8S9HD01_BRACR|nr:hypothetical protein F2Q68_00017557 [Brassica cretica]